MIAEKHIVPVMEIGEFVLGHANDLQLNKRNFGLSEISQALTAIKLAAKVINREISKTNGFSLDQSLVQSAQSDADIINLATSKFLDAVQNREVVAGISFYPSNTFIKCKNGENKHLVMVVHPMDGNKCVDINVSLGSIFSIYERKTAIGGPCEIQDFLQHGRDQIAAGYVIYGTSTMMVCTLGKGCYGFTVDPSIGTFYLSHPNLKIPEDGKIFSVNGDDRKVFNPKVKTYLDMCREKVFAFRYIGSLVADFHRNMLKGAIYIAPPTTDPKYLTISLVYQAFPLAFLAEQCNGKASSGDGRLLDIEAKTLHENTPFICGSKNLITDFEKCLHS